jgi:hypothetical protein
VCNAENKVYVYDRGPKFWRRLFTGNNRFACRNCKVTWRRKKPDDHARLEKRSSMVNRTQRINRNYRPHLDFSKLKKNYKTYGIIGALSAVIAYLLFGLFPHVVQEMAPKQETRVQSPGKNGGPPPYLRNDKKSGDQELQRRGNGK